MTNETVSAGVDGRERGEEEGSEEASEEGEEEASEEVYNQGEEEMSQKRTRSLSNETHITPPSTTEPSAVTDGVNIAGADYIVLLLKETAGSSWDAKLWAYYPKADSTGSAAGWLVVGDFEGNGVFTVPASSKVSKVTHVPGATRAYIEKDSGSGTPVGGIVAVYTGA